MAKYIDITVRLDSIGERQCSINIGGQQLLINGDALYAALEKGNELESSYDRGIDTLATIEELSR